MIGGNSMNCRFSSFVLSVWDFCEKKYNKIKVYFLVRKNLLQYEVYYRRLPNVRA